jgi:hypothetical protein
MTARISREPRVAEDGLFTRLAKAAFRGSTALGTSMSTANEAYGMAGGETLWTDRELNLVGQARFDEFDRMVRDISIIAAGVRLFLNLLANAVWTVNPPEDLPEAQQAEAQGYADLAYDMLYDMTSSWSTVVKKAAGFRLQGFSIMEWTAKLREDGAIGLLDIEHRPQRTITKWKRDKSGTVESVFQRVPGRPEVELPRAKIVYAVDDTLTDHPEGVGLFRHLATTAARLRTFLDLEEVGFETDLRGIPVARAPLSELKKEVEDSGPEGSEARAKAESRRVGMLRPMREFIEKHIRNKKTGVLLPSETFMAKATDGAQTPSSVAKWTLELLTGDAQSFAEVAAAVKEMKQDLARILGTEHLLLGSDGAGSLALARSKVGTFYLTVTSTLLDLLEVFDRDVLDPISELNGWPEELRPQMGVNEISDRDIEQVLDALAKLAQAGAPMMPGDPAEGEIYDLLGLTRPPERVPETDLSLNPNRNDPADPDKPIEGDAEKPMAKVLKSRHRRRMRRAA